MSPRKLHVTSASGARDARDRVFDALPDGVVVLDCAWRIVDANPAASRLLGRTRHSLIGAPLGAVLPTLGSQGDLVRLGARSIDLVLDDEPATRHLLAHLTPIGDPA